MCVEMHLKLLQKNPDSNLLICAIFYLQQIAELQKENFSLKLRIYFLEERMKKEFDASGEDIYKIVSHNVHSVFLSYWFPNRFRVRSAFCFHVSHYVVAQIIFLISASYCRAASFASFH